MKRLLPTELPLSFFLIFFLLTIFSGWCINNVMSGRYNQQNHYHHYTSNVLAAASSQQVPQQVIGYHYPVPTVQLSSASSMHRPQTKPAPSTMATTTTTTAAGTATMSTTMSSSSHQPLTSMMAMTTLASAAPTVTTSHGKPSTTTAASKSGHHSSIPKVIGSIHKMNTGHVVSGGATASHNTHISHKNHHQPAEHVNDEHDHEHTMNHSNVEATIVPNPTGSDTAPVPSSAAATEDAEDVFHPLRTPMVQSIDVACGKERMTVRISFDQEFNGIVYAKGHYNDPNCRFVVPNSGHKMYQFDLSTGECGVNYIDSGLNNGGQAFVEGLLVIIAEPGVQEAWDAARKIRCLWEGNLEQTVTFPLSVNTLDQKLLTFSGDTASVSLEIQSGRGPRAQTVQGLVRIGDMLTAVVNVQGDNAFDLQVKNCVATDGTPDNRIELTNTDLSPFDIYFRMNNGQNDMNSKTNSSQGCAVKPKLMGGWMKQKTSTNVVAYAYLAAFKFPDVMDLFLECTVSLCKGECEECPEFIELHVPVHETPVIGIGSARSPPASTSAASYSAEDEHEVENKVSATAKRSNGKRSSSRIKRSISNNTVVSEESLKLRRIVHVVGPDDLPEFDRTGSAVYGNCHTDCFSLLGIALASAVTIVMMMVCLAIYGTVRRREMLNKC